MFDRKMGSYYASTITSIMNWSVEYHFSCGTVDNNYFEADDNLKFLINTRKRRKIHALFLEKAWSKGSHFPA